MCCLRLLLLLSLYYIVVEESVRLRFMGDAIHHHNGGDDINLNIMSAVDAMAIAVPFVGVVSGSFLF